MANSLSDLYYGLLADQQPQGLLSQYQPGGLLGNPINPIARRNTLADFGYQPPKYNKLSTYDLAQVLAGTANSTILPFMPGAGDVIAAKDSAELGGRAAQSAKSGNYGDAALWGLQSLGAGLGALPFIPAVGGMVKKLSDANEKIRVFHGGTVEGKHFNDKNQLHWFAGNKKFADKFAQYSNGRTGEYLLSVKKPFNTIDLGDAEYSIDEWVKILSDRGIKIDAGDLENWAPQYGLYTFYDLLPHAGNNYFNGRPSALVKKLKESGFDAILSRETTDGVDSGPVYAVFDKAKIEQ